MRIRVFLSLVVVLTWPVAALLLMLSAGSIGYCEEPSRVKFAPPAGARVTSKIESSVTVHRYDDLTTTIHLKATVQWTAQEKKDGFYQVDAEARELELSFKREEKSSGGNKTLDLTFRWTPGSDWSLLKGIEELENVAHFIRNPLRCRVDRDGCLADSPHAIVYIEPPMGWAYSIVDCMHFIGVALPLPKIISEAKVAELVQGTEIVKVEESIPGAFSSSALGKITSVVGDRLTFLLEGRLEVGPNANETPVSLPKYPDAKFRMEMTWDTAKNLPLSFQGTAELGIYEAGTKKGTLKQEYKVTNSVE